MPHWQSWQALAVLASPDDYCGRRWATSKDKMTQPGSPHRTHASTRYHKQSQPATLSGRDTQPPMVPGKHGRSKTVAGQYAGWQCELVAAASRGSLGQEEERTHEKAADGGGMACAELHSMFPINERQGPRLGGRRSAGQRKGQGECCEDAHVVVCGVLSRCWRCEFNCSHSRGWST